MRELRVEELREEDTIMLLEAKANMEILLEDTEDKGKEDTPCSSREEEEDTTTTAGNRVVLTVEHKAGMQELLEGMEVNSLR